MTTVHELASTDWCIRKWPGNKCTNGKTASETFCDLTEKAMAILQCINDYNQHMGRGCNCQPAAQQLWHPTDLLSYLVANSCIGPRYDGYKCILYPPGYATDHWCWYLTQGVLIAVRLGIDPCRAQNSITTKTRSQPGQCDTANLSASRATVWLWPPSNTSRQTPCLLPV